MVRAPHTSTQATPTLTSSSSSPRLLLPWLALWCSLGGLWLVVQCSAAAYAEPRLSDVDITPLMSGLLVSLLAGGLAVATQLRSTSSPSSSSTPLVERVRLALVVGGFAPGLLAMSTAAVLFVGMAFGLFHFLLTGAPPQGW